ncbi:MAG: HlyD family efflux transporter periplasmic adaptor subunit [Candidatus Moraniibacteriota bacterium]|nr:MAG: HlyD family efflux transporter periplasmic adaptor subunit [Candidatus Moranbacteria bacterium]
MYYESVKSAADQERKAADAAYQNAKDYESDAKKYYEGVVDARGEDSSESRSAKLTLTTAVNARKSADEARKTIEKNRENSVTAAKNAWSAAREKVETLTSSGQRLLETSALRSAEAAYAVSLENGKRAAIVAPVNGKIVKLNYEEGEVVGTSIASPFGKLLSYDLLLEVKVPESDVTRLRSGMGATVSFDAFEEGDTVLAEVISVEPDATVIQDVVYYIAKLRLSNRDERLKPGMTGDADIHISEKRGVLLLPERLLKESGETKQARVLLPDARVETRMVTTGLRGDDGMIEILSGLSENDAIISDAEKR